MLLTFLHHPQSLLDPCRNWHAFDLAEFFGRGRREPEYVIPASDDGSREPTVVLALDVGHQFGWCAVLGSDMAGTYADETATSSPVSNECPLLIAALSRLLQETKALCMHEVVVRLSVDFSAVSNGDHKDNKIGIIYFVNDPVVAGADPPCLPSAQFLNARRAWGNRELSDRVNDSELDT